LKLGSKYTGKYRNHAVYTGLAADLRAALEYTSERFEACLSMELDTHSVEFHPADKGDHSDGLHAITATESRGGRRVQRVTLYLEYLVTGHIDLKQTLCHELVHAVQRRAVGAAYRRVPKWLREGLALLVADQGEDRIDTLLCVHALDSGSGPEALLLPLTDRTTLRHYGIYYAAVRSLVDLDPHRLRRLWDGLAQGRPPRELVTEMSGRPFDAWCLDAHSRFAAELRDRCGERHRVWRQISEAHARREWQATVERVDHLVQDDPESYCVPRALMLRGHAHQHLSNAEAALADFETVLSHHARTSDQAPIAARKRCSLLLHLGRLEDAHRAAHHFVRDYSYLSRPVAEVQRLLKRIHSMPRGT
jgi:hypothetical protein